MHKSVLFALLLTLAGYASPAFTQWLYYGGDQGGQHHSPLSQINRDTVDDLELAWTYQTGELEQHPEQKSFASFHATPILLPEAAGQSLTFCTPFNRIIAVDPTTGAERWAFDAKIDIPDSGMVRFNCRGIAYWQDSQQTKECQHRLFMGTFDLRLTAVDALTGKACPDFGDNGFINIKNSLLAEINAKAKLTGRPAQLKAGDVQFSSPPVVIGDIVIIGSSNNTKGKRIDGPSGMVRAFNARTGEPAWQFDPVPRNVKDPEHRNWTKAALEVTGAANVWSMMAVDEERDLVFLPTASASPDFFGGTRPGDNRYANSVVALRGSTGEVVWHFQIVHHDVWDLDIPAQPILTRVNKDGESIPVVVQLTKQGLIFVLHRDTGEPVFGVEERPVPTDGVAGELLACRFVTAARPRDDRRYMAPVQFHENAAKIVFG